jgi:formate hydrogenlyase transcriptional activator
VALDAPPDPRYEALLKVSRSILAHQELEALMHDLAGLLRQVLQFDFLSLVLHDAVRDVMELRILATAAPRDSELRPHEPAPVGESPAGWVWREQRPLLIHDVEHESRWPRVIPLIRANGVRSICLVPLSTARRKLGALAFGFRETLSLPDADIRFMESVGSQVAAAVENALSHNELARERDRLQTLLEINNALVSNRTEKELFRMVSSCLTRVTPHDYASLALERPPGSGRFLLRGLEFPKGSGLIYADAEIPADGSPAQVALEKREPVRFDGAWLAASRSTGAKALFAEGIRTLICLPLLTRNRALGTLNLGSFEEGAFTSEDLAFVSQVATQIAIAIENAMAFFEISQLTDRLSEEKLYLEDEIRSELDFGEMIGHSPKFRRALKQVETVAATPATVLILGETGTGKELIARAIHDRSDRQDRTFVKVNCAAIPTGLLESELFGHEKGAFTGAISQRTGRLELADKGTLFLDEVGDIPLELQPKLLRALQEHEFERLGSSRTIRVDVRVVAATNRDLPQMVADHQFRADLYYRLNVFPLQVPALRERREDIPALVRHFALRFARRMGRTIDTIPADTLERLRRYDWPGNVRELENLIERAVILSTGPVLQVPELGGSGTAEPAGLTLAGAERAHIHRVLRECDWVVSAAAVQLGMKRTTLQSRMHKLGIVRGR